jgi:hypothetical protein
VSARPEAHLSAHAGLYGQLPLARATRGPAMTERTATVIWHDQDPGPQFRHQPFEEVAGRLPFPTGMAAVGQRVAGRVRMASGSGIPATEGKPSSSPAWASCTAYPSRCLTRCNSLGIPPDGDQDPGPQFRHQPFEEVAGRLPFPTGMAAAHAGLYGQLPLARATRGPAMTERTATVIWQVLRDPRSRAIQIESTPPARAASRTRRRFSRRT